MRAKDFVNEISRDRLERYLSRAGQQVDTRQERMARARARLNTSYEIYHAENPSKIVDRFEADTPQLAHKYYQDYINNYDSDVDYDLSLRAATGIDAQLEEGWKDWAAGAAAVGALGGALHGYDSLPDRFPEPQAHVQQATTPQQTVAPQQVKKPTAPALTQQQFDQTAQALASPLAKVLQKIAIASGITGHELAQFMAQTAHESANFTSLKEFGGKRDFKKYDIKHNPAKAKALGNLHPGDGAKYAGRGFIQLTGRYNYKKAGEALGLPLEKHPELVERPEVAAKVAVWFWKNRVKPQVDNFNNTAEVTKPINPGMRGLQDRDTKYQAIKQGAMVKSKNLAPRGTKI